jgi:hypothetical protein
MWAKACKVLTLKFIHKVAEIVDGNSIDFLILAVHGQNLTI